MPEPETDASVCASLVRAFSLKFKTLVVSNQTAIKGNSDFRKVIQPTADLQLPRRNVFVETRLDQCN